MTVQVAPQALTALESPQISPRLANKHIIKLPVPVGQTDIATRVLHGIYQKEPVLSDLSDTQLLQLLLLTDRFDVPKVKAAVLRSFTSLSMDNMQWDTALQLLDLPFGWVDHPGYTQIVATAESRLMQELGDLEMVLGDELRRTGCCSCHMQCSCDCCSMIRLKLRMNVQL